MALGVVGQRCISEREPELGLGVVSRLERGRIAVDFPATAETRLYTLGTSVLKRVIFQPGERVQGREGEPLLIETVTEEEGLLIYAGQGRRLREDAVSDRTSVSSPPDRLLAGQSDPTDVFDLRLRTLQHQAQLRQSPVRGFVGGRVDLIPHQFYILQEVASRQIPRVLLADEVGLGKTIEACLIVQRLLAIGRARRVLILVPESLTHQWFVELLRRFHLWFSIFDEARGTAVSAAEPGTNVFLSSQLALANLEWLAHAPDERAAALAAGWDIVVVDEAHHLAWSPDETSAEYEFVEQLAQTTPGLLLLTATPTQLGPLGHFARLRLLDPQRYPDYAQFVQESQRYAAVAQIAAKLLEDQPLTSEDLGQLRDLFDRDPAALEALRPGLTDGQTQARSRLLQRLLDQHGTGRVMFRNTRARMTGFPPRLFRPVPLEEAPPSPSDDAASIDDTPVETGLSHSAARARVARELRAEETGETGSLRYSYKHDPRVVWLADFLRADRQRKVLLIGKSPRKILALEAALRERINLNVGLFHEGLPLVQRDRQAAWFAEPDGAQLLLCSEIGSEGRNFQFAHHLVLFDLPLHPGLLEQRIGRLDRIGQKHPIHLHVPYLVGSSDECLVRWYHEGLEAFASPLPAGDEYATRFRAQLLELAERYGTGRPGAAEDLTQLIAATRTFRAELSAVLRQGRDRLLELNSHRPEVAAGIVERIRAADTDPGLRRFLLELLDHFGVRIKEHEGGDLFLDPAHAYVEAFPSLPAEGMLATFQRSRALAREDIRFLSADHPLIEDAMQLLINSPRGTTAFATLPADEPNVLLEAIFVLEAVADTRWHVDQFLAPTPVRVVIDLRGEDQTAEYPSDLLATELDEANLPRFLEQERLPAPALRQLLGAATDEAEARCTDLRQAAATLAQEALGSEWQRLVDLQKINDHVRTDEVALARQQLERTLEAISQARLRLDSLRLILAGPVRRD